jgi:hypothetical protein
MRYLTRYNRSELLLDIEYLKKFLNGMTFKSIGLEAGLTALRVSSRCLRVVMVLREHKGYCEALEEHLKASGYKPLALRNVRDLLFKHIASLEESLKKPQAPKSAAKKPVKDHRVNYELLDDMYTRLVVRVNEA